MWRLRRALAVYLLRPIAQLLYQPALAWQAWVPWARLADRLWPGD